MIDFWLGDLIQFVLISGIAAQRETLEADMISCPCFEAAVFRYELKGEKRRFLREYARKRHPQREYKSDIRGFCGARSNTTAVDEAQYSTHLAYLSLSNTIKIIEFFGVDDRVRRYIQPNYSLGLVDRRIVLWLTKL